jgi:pyruvate dehydrogenase E1 component beta subunit
VEETKKGAELLKKDGIIAEVIDLVSSSPVDYDTICASVKKTGRLVVLDISWEPFGLAAQVSAEVSGRLLKDLKGPVERITLPFSPTPTASALEAVYYPTADGIYKKCTDLFKKTK